METTEYEWQSYILDQLENGKELCAANIKDLLFKKFSEVISIRTAQRYIKQLEYLEPKIDHYFKGRTKYIMIEEEFRVVKQSNILSQDWEKEAKKLGNYLLSLNLLKAHLESFKETEIADDIEELIRKIEKLTGKEDIISSDSLYWDQNYGKFNYTRAGADYIKTIDQLTEKIVEKEWIKIEYEKEHGKDKNYLVYPYQFFYFGGTLYLASYMPGKQKVFTLAIHKIKKISSPSKETIEEMKSKRVPKFDYKKFRETRFGVWVGEPVRVMLEVHQDYRRYFKNRIFHDSQITFEEDNEADNIRIRMDVPLAPELISWILKWNGGLKVISPQELKDKVREAAIDIINVHS